MRYYLGTIAGLLLFGGGFLYSIANDRHMFEPVETSLGPLIEYEETPFMIVDMQLPETPEGFDIFDGRSKDSMPLHIALDVALGEDDQ